MLCSFTTRLHNFIWFLIFTFTLYCIPNYELLFPFKIHIGWNEAYASENNSEDTSKAISSDKSTIKEGVSADKESTEEKSSEVKAAAGSETQLMSQGTEGGGGGGSGVLGTSLHTPESYLFTGAATYKVPIQVPPGRGGMAPNLSLIYNSYQGSGWLGVGWSLDLGSIQRSTKRGLSYSANEYVSSVNGSYSELIARSDWGANYYGSKIEGAFFKYYLNSTTGGWEVTTKDGTKYYYGTTSASRQDNANGVFKWCLDKVLDTKGNYMTVSYSKDQGEIYPDQIDYTGNGSLSPTNYVKFYLESRTDVTPIYRTHSQVKTTKRLKTIDIVANGQRVSAYALSFTTSGNTSRSLLASVQKFGNNATLNGEGGITGGTALPAITFGPQSFPGTYASDLPLSNMPDVLAVWNQTETNSGRTLADMNGDGLPDLVVSIYRDSTYHKNVYLNTGSGWVYDSALSNMPDVLAVWNQTETNSGRTLADVDGDGLMDIIVSIYFDNNYIKSVWLNTGPMPDLVVTVNNGIGGTSTITYTPSSAYTNTLMPFILQTVSSISVDDGKGNISTTTHTYEGGLFDYADREFRGFRKGTSYQMFDAQYYESKTETWFHQDYSSKGLIETQILTSAEGHTRRVDNILENISTPGGGNFPSLKEATSTITDVGYPSYTSRNTFIYDQYGNVLLEHKYGMTTEDEIHTYFSYTNFTDKWILSKPTDINIKNASQNIVGRKWMDYDSNTGNMLTEEVCKSDTPNTGCTSRNATQNPVITYQYYSDVGNLWKITDPRNYTTTINYDATKTFVYETINTLGHKTTTEYDPGTGNLKKLIPPHLQGTAYSFTNTFDVFGRKIREDRPDGGWTSYGYINIGNPTAQYIEKREHIIGGPSPLDHYTYAFFDGLGRTYWVESTGPAGKTIITETWYDNLGRVSDKSNPYFYGIDTPYYTSFTYDGLSRVIDVLTPDNYHIGTSYQGLKKVVTDQNNHSTSSTFDVYQRLKKVEDVNGSITEYSYDTLGNLTQVIAAKGNTEQNTTTMTYDSLSKKRSMNDPDMGQWTYDYDKSGNLELQTDAKGQKIRFKYDGLNRVYKKRYGDPTPLSTVYYTYDQISIGKLNKVSYQPSGEDLREDNVLECDLMQRATKGQKTIGAQSATFEKSYDTAGRALSIKYLAGTPNEKTYSYEYDMAGNLLYVKDNATGNHMVDYSDFTALGQQKIATFPKPANVSVKTTYTYDPQTARLKTLITQKLLGANPTDTYQNLDYQQFDGKGNLITLADTLNGINHGYTYDSLDRLLTANGAGTNPYTQSYQYDRVGNITFKSDVGSYSYTYSSKPHAVRTAGNISLQYDLNGNMTRRSVSGGIRLDITYNYDNKPSLIKKNGSNYIKFTYDGNGQRVKKYNYSTGQTTLYFGELYETRGGAGIIHVFAGSQRVASALAGGSTQFYHSNHLGSSSVITDQNGDKKEKMEYFPFGTYRETVDYDANFPDVFYTFTGQEDDDDLGLYNYHARLYDPALGRFISPDRLVPSPGNLQAFNRYSYCLNNPLIYTDPSGEFFDIFGIISTILSVIAGSTMGAYQAKRSGENVYKGAQCCPK